MFVICLPSRTIDYDYAIIKLLHPVTFSASVAPVCLPPPLQQGRDQPSLEGGACNSIDDVIIIISRVWVWW